MAEVVQGPGANRAPRPALEEFRTLTPAAWQGLDPPQVRWMVNGAFPEGAVAILAGDGGLGKSLLCQMLQTALALGVPWLGMPTVQCPSLAIYCEDDERELQRRQHAIAEHYGCPMTALGGVHMQSRVGLDSVLMRFKQWGDDGVQTPLLSQVRHAARTTGARVLILDTLADMFAGNENDRNQPRSFIRPLRQLAIEMKGAVIVTQHPSNEGVASGSGLSGSRGWHNSVRARLYLTAPKKKGADGESEPSPTERVLKTMKVNGARNGGKIPLTWSRGVYVRTDDANAAYYAERDASDWDSV